MEHFELPQNIAGLRIHLVGVKGTGLCALAELLIAGGALLSGSDTHEQFYTDAILQQLGIPYTEGFDSASLPADCAVVIHSAAYSPESNPELSRAVELGIPCIKYPEALGAFSARADSAAVAGVHGKTTTTSLAGVLCKALGLSASVLVGSAVADFGGRSTYSGGTRFFVAETCEYRRHFLAFHPSRMILTSVECDHQDYFPDFTSIQTAFIEFIHSLPQGGLLVYCADDEGARQTVALATATRPDLRLLPYGFNADSGFAIKSCSAQRERTLFKLASFSKEFALRMPGRHLALNAAAALALVHDMVVAEFGAWTEAHTEAAAAALEGFRGASRRSEIVGEAGGVLIMDDYGHHPTAVKTTLAGLKAFYPDRRLIVSFMSHTYTRTAALLEEFAAAFSDADILWLHKIYASAREGYTGSINGQTLYEKAKALGGDVRWSEEPNEALDELLQELRPGDLFVTMGAGDNWTLGRKALAALQEKEHV
jgi:UDP-N-acetylmuramate--alanine ligase